MGRAGKREGDLDVLSGGPVRCGVAEFSRWHSLDRMRTNALQVLRPYRHHGTWVFDDPTVGLEQEPFVSGIPEMIDQLVRDVPDAENGFRLIFSTQPFPGYAAKLEWRREELGGNWYYSPTYEREGWLCPALFKYFASAPRELYAKAEPLAR